MTLTESSKELQNKIADADHIVVIQADNPDGDSLASALALEDILGELGREVTLYCSVDMPEYLRYHAGWDRIVHEIPNQFDAAIMVDCSYIRLLENAEKKGEIHRLATRPFITIDHHDEPSSIPFEHTSICDPKAAATGQVIYKVATELKWPITKTAATFLVSSILSDSLGLTSEILDDNPEPFTILANLVSKGVSLARLNEQRLERLKITPELMRYKGQLMQRVEFFHDNHIATITIDHEEIKNFSLMYNPTVILDEMRFVENVAVTIGFKSYHKLGEIYRITGRIRCNRGYTVAKELAEAFGGGGHLYASGFKIEGNNLDLEEVKLEVIKKAAQLIAK